MALAPNVPELDPSSPSPTLDGAHRAALAYHFVSRDLTALNAVLAGLPGPLERLRIDIVDNARAAEAAPVWRVDPDGRHRFRFHEKTWKQHPGFIFDRWLDTLPLIAAVQAVEPIGSCVLNLGDDGHRPGLAFDGTEPSSILIPDCFFLKTHGFAGLARTYAQQARPWRERRPVLFWRGTTTGRETSLDALPRVRMCRGAKELGEMADVGFSAASQQFTGAESWLCEQGLLRDFVSNQRFGDYQLHLSIDGNASPWGLLAKLHTGSPVLKVGSPRGHRQWYYDRLVPWTNYVPIRSDMADLHETVRTLLSDPARAERIGAAGQLLARGLTYEAELTAAVPIAAAAFENVVRTISIPYERHHLGGAGGSLVM